ncbi:uncharacterized protein MONBRDRAFT_8862 [Monosiga brevicollis MX1]|uniref:Uncharacterized protein n=1 Tax=Monosiga brevicollis TaxID=81824 RepID=A9V1C4_MONBE|nr:uncharacterized protein MONBRDRAFT_8862 [Monosiga brevicollis MX1]EDQ88541.1 predicted protein [Monosiga brevicollis MX1]|eukprot:XP_001746645.1 hypothetical protein [Monosiga brevicollis MX1]
MEGLPSRDQCAAILQALLSQRAAEALGTLRSWTASQRTAALKAYPDLMCRKGHPQVVQALLDGGADLHCKDKRQQSVLHLAIIYGQTELTAIFLAAGADVHASDVVRSLCLWQNTPLHVACRRRKVDAVRALLQAGARVDAQNEDGLQPLHCGAHGGDLHVVHLLLEHGADPKVADITGRTPLHLAVLYGAQYQVLEALIFAGGSIDAADEVSRFVNGFERH